MPEEFVLRIRRMVDEEIFGIRCERAVYVDVTEKVRWAPSRQRVTVCRRRPNSRAVGACGAQCGATHVGSGEGVICAVTAGADTARADMARDVDIARA